MTRTHEHTTIMTTNNQNTLTLTYAPVGKLPRRDCNSRVIRIVRSLLLRERAGRKTIEKYYFDQADGLLYGTGGDITGYKS